MKWGKCPICKGTVRRNGIRLKNGKRINIIAPHYCGQTSCSGSILPWRIIEPEKTTHIKQRIVIEEIHNNNQL